MRRILLLAVTCVLSVAGYAQTVFQPSTTASLTGGGTYCVGTSLPPLTYTYNTCNAGVGPIAPAVCQITWYYNPTNTTTITPGVTTTASVSTLFASSTSSTGVQTFTPLLPTGGNYYFFCVLTWTSGTAGCGGTSGSITSGTELVTVSPAPIAPTAPINICLGSNTVLTNPFSGGTWSSSNAAVVNINPTTGFAVGASVGGSFITYTLGGCYTTSFMYVNDTPATITPITPVNICVGNTRTLGSATTGGRWYTSAPTTASIDSVTGLVSAFTPGTATITYRIPSTGCSTRKLIGVLPNPNPITGSSNVCVAGTTTLATTTVGGSWVSSNTSRATVNTSTGVVTGVSAGTVTISYLLGTGCFALHNMTVNLPGAAITGGPSSFCDGTTVTFANSVPGGAWSTSNPAKATIGTSTGVMNALDSGSVTISYTTPGCAAATRTISINPLPGTIGGVLLACYNRTTNLSSSGVPGGAWTSSDTNIARVNVLTGVVTGRTMGVATITYTVGSGCFSTANVTVNPLAEITGFDSVCMGGSIALTNIVGGGTWASSNVANATVNPTTGIVTGVLNGITHIIYTLPSGCFDSILISVLPPLPSIGGALAICSGTSVTLSNAAAGGSWSTSNPYIAEVNATTGRFTGRFPDTAIITYSVFGCSTSSVVTVHPLPSVSITYNWATNSLFIPAGYVSYQWFDSTTVVAPIAGATNNSYVVPTSKGLYAVRAIDANGCTAFSPWYKHAVSVDGLDNVANDIVVFPNPATSVVNVSTTLKNVEATLTTIDGRVMSSTKNATSINIEHMPVGLYLLNFTDEAGNRIKVVKLTKQ